MASFITFLRKCETSISSFNSNRCRGYTLGIYADEKAEYVGKLSASANMPTHSEFFGRFANFRLGYVGAIDGFFQRTLMPRKKDCANNQTAYAYVSGQYEHYGVNCQGIFDVEGRYLFFGVASPGKTNDALSFVNAGCRKILRDIPASTYVVGDEAFKFSKDLIMPFTGSLRANPLGDSFIFS